jgi:hypothetical protein
MNKQIMTDEELDKLLQLAPQPTLPNGFAKRLQTKLDAPVVNNVVAFPQRTKPAGSNRMAWLSAIPLAASLAIGLYLGAMAELPDMFSGLQDAMASLSTDSGLNLGIEDTELFLNGELS